LAENRSLPATGMCAAEIPIGIGLIIANRVPENGAGIIDSLTIALNQATEIKQKFIVKESKTNKKWGSCQ